MKFRYFLLVLAALIATNAGRASVENSTVQSRQGSYADMHAQQGIGRIEVTSDGRFVIYEWGHPYFGWVPETGWMSRRAASRLQTSLYVVDLAEANPRSEYPFYPSAGSTYWLGDISPDSRAVLVFELNHDDRRVRAGVWKFGERGNQVRWLVPQADEGKLTELAAWVSNEEFVYPIKNKANPLVKVSLSSGDVQPCAGCSADMVRLLRANSAVTAESGKTAASRIEAYDVARDAKLIAGAPNGSVAVYVRDTSEVLSLVIKQPEEPAKVMFENTRKWRAPEVPK